ncbi:DUF3718 domain-containing protein [Paraferrimonas sedimenticola]|uniref:DUF3718 domain-containing protein n=1 Tax=Paraferrimonas sedimenticola TaxID=375674 RepID=A0AA37RS89_9GAMM|nr:DUF3718 domain-containing protein [Paraferrimonas sedimenticola]GLP95420.1 hypothetical protein GCM10007895_07260 [Paraferrimonas sedimenticola]
MKIRTFAIAALVAATPLAHAEDKQAMSPYIENALIDVCKAAMSDNVFRMNKTIKSYRLKTKTVALKVVCNGEDITTFAANQGANRTSERLERSVGSVGIQDIAMHQKLQVTFDLD